MPTLKAQTGGFGWSTAWFPEGETWDDEYAWADVSAWEANARTPLVLGEAANAVTFTVNGQAANKALTDNIGYGNFTFNGRPISEQISERFAHGSFATTGQDANVHITERADPSIFSLAGQEGEKALSELAAGQFFIEGQDINEGISEATDFGTFTFAYQDALLYKPRYTFDGELSTVTLVTGEPNIVELVATLNSATISINTPNYS